MTSRTGQLERSRDHTAGQRASLLRWAAVAAVVGLHIWAGQGTEFSLNKLRDLPTTFQFVADSMWPPKWEFTGKAFGATLTTLHIALMGTSLAIAAALPLAFWGAFNTAPNRPVYRVVRSGLTFIRSVPEVVLALMLVPTLGLGPFPGVIALAVHNLGVLGKLISELVESAPIGPQEAVASTGASKGFVIMYGILPQILPDVISQAFYRFEVSIRASLILGFIGAGGLGELVFLSFMVFQYREMVVYILFMMLLVAFADGLSSAVRRRVI